MRNMAKIISFEGCIGAGKTSLVKYLSKELGCNKILEHQYKNPFITKFCKGANVGLETELTFLLQHYSLLKNINAKAEIVLSDFSIEKDLVFARMNLEPSEFNIFKSVYKFVENRTLKPNIIFFLDLPSQLLRKRIKARGRAHEMLLNTLYFEQYCERLKRYFLNESESKVLFIKAYDLELSDANAKFNQIIDTITGEK